VDNHSDHSGGRRCARDRLRLDAERARLEQSLALLPPSYGSLFEGHLVGSGMTDYVDHATPYADWSIDALEKAPGLAILFEGASTRPGIGGRKARISPTPSSLSELAPRSGVTH